MKTRHFILLGCLAAAHSFGQGTFQNLDFESAVINPVVVGSFTYTEFGGAYPGWTGFSSSLILYNNLFIGTSTLGILESNFSYPEFLAHGRFTAVLQGGTATNGTDVSLRQTGTVPLGTRFLQFYAFSTKNTFTVSLNGNPLGLSISEDFGRYKEYGADISGYAGQTAELRFTQHHGYPNDGSLFLDDIVFSAVPEPGPWALLALGSAALWCTMLRRRKRRCSLTFCSVASRLRTASDRAC